MVANGNCDFVFYPIGFFRFWCHHNNHGCCVVDCIENCFPPFRTFSYPVFVDPNLDAFSFQFGLEFFGIASILDTVADKNVWHKSTVLAQ